MPAARGGNEVAIADGISPIAGAIAAGSDTDAAEAQPDTPPEVDEFDLADAELESETDSIMTELEVQFSLEPDGGITDADSAADGAGVADEGGGADAEFVASVAAGLNEMLGEGDDEAIASVAPPPSTSASSTDAPPPSAAEPPAVEGQPWQRLSAPSAQGYIYDGMRSVMRVQRGKPAKSVIVNCYLHTGCRMLLAESRCPTDDVLKQWLFAVPAPSPTASADERKALAKQRMSLGRGQWFAGQKRQ